MVPSLDVGKMSLKEAKTKNCNGKDLKIKYRKKSRPVTAEEIKEILDQSDDDLSEISVSSAVDSDENEISSDLDSVVKRRSNKTNQKNNHRSSSSDSEKTPLKLKNRKRKKSSQKYESDDSNKLLSKKRDSKQNEKRKEEWENGSDSDDEPLIKRKSEVTPLKGKEKAESKDSDFHNRKRGKRSKIMEGRERKSKAVKDEPMGSDSDDERMSENGYGKCKSNACNGNLEKKKGTVAKAKTAVRKRYESDSSSDGKSENSEELKGKRNEPQQEDKCSSSDDSDSKPLVRKRGKYKITLKKSDPESSDSHSESLDENGRDVKKKGKNSVLDVEEDESEKSYDSDSQPDEERMSENGYGKRKSNACNGNLKEKKGTVAKAKTAVRKGNESDCSSDGKSENSEPNGKRNQPQQEDECSSSEDSDSKPLVRKRGKSRLTLKKSDPESSDSRSEFLDEKGSKVKGTTEEPENSDDSENGRDVKKKGKNSLLDVEGDESEKSCDSDSQPLAAVRAKTCKLKRPRESSDESESDSEHVSKRINEGATKRNKKKNNSRESDSGISCKKESFGKGENNSPKDESDSDIDIKDKEVRNSKKSKSKPMVKMTSSDSQKKKTGYGPHMEKKRNSNDSDSEEEKEQKTKVSSVKVTKFLKEESSSSDTSLNSDSEGEPQNKTEKHEEKKVKKKLEPVGKHKKKSDQLKKTDNQLALLKKYVHLLGIRIRNYEVLFKGCNSIKSKKEKLLQIMQERGLEGRPTIEKCKKIRKRYEQKKELEELDMNNIISNSGRGQRNSYSLYASRNVSPPRDNLLSPVKPSKARLILESESE